MSNLMQVFKMHEKFGISRLTIPNFSTEERNFRIACMKEELEEYIDSETRADDLDALIDLIIFALGTVERQGLAPVFEEAFERVMKANCNKELGGNEKRGSFAIDLVKPVGWKSPCFKDLIKS